MSWMLQPAYANPCCAMPRHSASRRVVRCSAAPAKLEVRVLVSSDGRLVCPDLPAGVYTVSSWWAGQGVRNEKALPAAPGCDVSRSRDCGVFCTLNEAGDLVCEGLMEGEYTVLNADPATQCTVAADGTTHCEGTETQLDVETAAVLASKTANKALGSFGG